MSRVLVTTDYLYQGDEVDVLLGLGEGPDGLEGVHFWGLDPDSISMLCSWMPRE